MHRLASSTVVPNAIRAIASLRILSASITNVITSCQESLVKSESPNYFSHHFSTEAKKQILDRKLVKILKSEIKSKQLVVEKSMPATPADFPFTIKDDPCERNISLTREFDGEKIDVVVVMPCNNIPKDDEEESDTSDDDDTGDNRGDGGDDYNSSMDTNSVDENENSGADPATSLMLVVNIFKENGKELHIWVSASADEIKMTSMSVKEPAEKCNDFRHYWVKLNTDMQFAFGEFLEIRGIKKSYVGFLHEYMVRKSEQQPMLALKELKKFVKE